MSTLRPELVSTDEPCMSEDAAYFRVLEAVKRRKTLVHGKLHDNSGRSCAIGCAFDEGVKVLPTKVINEIAAYNDSFPKLTPQQRRNKVLQWLKFKSAQVAKAGAAKK